MVSQFIEKKYRNEEFIIQKKAKFLFWFCLVMALSLTFLYAITVIRNPATMVDTAIAIFPVVAVALICLCLVLFGKYQIAGHILCAAVAFGTLYGVYFNREHAFSSSSHYGPGLILLAILFSNRIVASVFFGLFLIAYFITYFVNYDIIVNNPILSSSFNDSWMTLVLTFIISLLIDYAMTKAVKTTRDESMSKERKHVDFISRLFDKIRDQMKKLTSSSESMSGMSRELSQNAQNQAAFVEEVSSTIEEVAGAVENISNSASEQYTGITSLISIMGELSSIITGMGRDSSEAMKITSEISEKTRLGEDSLKNMNNTMSKIISSSQEMTNIVEIINDISDRINLLSLNAAIEAARAGDAGRGFAVVADEISKLADQTATSIKSINDLINANDREITDGMTSVNRTIETMGAILEGINRISEKSKVISQTMDRQVKTNDQVNVEAERLKNFSNEIKNATEELKEVVNEITKSTNNINELTQAHAAGAERISENAETLNTIAVQMNQEIEAKEE